ncbi:MULTISPECIES: type VII secretion protein EccCa [Actinoalloteichus]|uniref:Type VII secretion protein EccCa/type VII secretion protein EccCb n=1 Tax=Actinoalloteichus fjordicus TaxID=1612552 RepID=A0AAC9PUF3_9PSEU|nr:MULTISPECIES: type VII secretion protein EccCa [Actinoalloteichus]APU17614.1 type VII secretion protein EccCa/type VII secretion protein EccCb [Actinoalloteichus fjordicus]APU23690.1 type VII secretion protein EccCa/type VII secretion protein EccCb [Actinoalloteichus sp. GBA129-24]
MSTLRFKRSPRLAAPRLPGGEVHLEPPPEVPRTIPGNIIQKLLPVIMIVASIGMMAFMFMVRRSPMMMMMGGMFLISTIGMMAGGRGNGQAQKKAEMNEDRKDYLRYLGQMRDRAREAADEQRAAREWSHPDPQALWSIAASSRRLWERRTNDPDFCQLRSGRGPQRLSTRLVPPQTGPVDELEPLTTLALRRFVRGHSILPDMPIAISLRGFAAIGLNGEREHTRPLARALLAQLATFHSPEDVLIAVVAAGKTKQEWEWVKWLPHAQHPTLTDGIGQLRMMAGSLGQIEAWLADQIRDRQRFSRNAPVQPDQPHIVIVIDDGDVSREEHILMEEGLVGVTLLDLSDSLGNLTSRRGLRMVVEADRLGAKGAGGVEWFGAPDGISLAEAEALARRLAPYRISAAAQQEEEDEPLLSNPGVLEMAGIPGDPMTFDVQEAWRPRPVRDRYKVAFGVGEHGQLVELDIKEAAAGGMGPHGLCVGATGSGKSEFLRTLVLGLLATHSSTSLNMILVDFKGGATFSGLDVAPHVAATITNLAGDLTMVDRMKDAIAGEMARRQEVLHKGNFKNVWDYQKARENGADLDPLPALFICIDEFSEMLVAKPDFIDLFLQIGRVGRSLQVHMLLASQRLEEGKLRGLDTFLSYRIGLKTFSASESRAAIGVPDAYELPSIPGSGYLKFDTTSMVRFKASYVSGPYRPAGIQVGPSSAPVTADRRPKLFVPDYIEIPQEPVQQVEEVKEEKKEEKADEPSSLDVLVGRLVGQGPPAHEVWLPPLTEPPSLDQLLPPLSQTEDRGLSPVGFYGNGRLTVPLGLVDKPFDQRRDLLWADLSGGKGHAAVVGGPQAGKSMLLRTLIMSMALTHTPQEVQFYCLDFGGGTLGSLAGLPHVGGVASRRDPDTVRRTFAEVSGIIAAREARFAQLNVDSMADYRARKRQGEAADDPFGDVFFIIDGWLNFKTEFDALEKQVQTLAAQGLSYGVHIIVAANRWAEVRPALKDLLLTRLELRLGDTTESEVDRRAAVNVPQGIPGRGLSPDKLHFLTGLPRVDAVSDAGDIGNGVGDAVAKITAAWKGPHAPKVRLLPQLLRYEEIPAFQQPAGKKLVPIGVDENELAPVFLDFESDPHFVAFAEREAGKTNLLRTIISGIVNNYTSKEALILLVDYRRTLLGYLQTDHLLEYAASAQQVKGYVADIKKSLDKRLPGPNVTQEELRNRSWWKGPELFIIVDDYELVSPQGANPLAPLAPYVAQAKDVGLHLILARNIAGGTRAGFEPIIGKMKEVTSPGIIMSGPKEESNILGNVKPTALPPGRGTIVSRRTGQQLIQIGWVEPEY